MSLTFADRVNDFLGNIPEEVINNDQDDFNYYLDLCRISSWDIPSALGFCPHQDWQMMHYRPGDDDWVEAASHFKEVHGLDLFDPAINWSFDT